MVEISILLEMMRRNPLSLLTLCLSLPCELILQHFLKVLVILLGWALSWSTAASFMAASSFSTPNAVISVADRPEKHAKDNSVDLSAIILSVHQVAFFKAAREADIN